MTTRPKRILVPVPEIQHVPTLFRKFQTGEIRIPAFQREFTWTEADVLALLDSVYKGFPIGSVLLWKVESPIFRSESHSDLPVPKVPEQYPTSYLLDGLQRLSTLYGVFHWSEEFKPSIFNVLFDLVAQEFRHFVETTQANDMAIPLAALFSPKRLLGVQSRLLRQSNGEELVARTLALQSVFQEYLIPTVTISQRDVKEVVEIFQRVNSTGTRLGPVDFMRALTWSEDFDLTERLDEIQEELSKRHFDLDQETLTKVLAVIAGIEPISTEMLSLRERRAAELNELVQRARQVLNRCIDFMETRLLIRSSEFLPYEGQLLFLVRIFANDKVASTTALSSVVPWFWSVSFNEGLRGKPDHFVARLLKSADTLVSGETQRMDARLNITPREFLDRRLIRGKALSAAFVTAFAARRVRSLVSGRTIPEERFVSTFDSDLFLPLVPLGILERLLGKKLPSSRVFANLVLVPLDEQAQIERSGWEATFRQLREKVGEEEWIAILDSQLLTAEIGRQIEADKVSVHTLEARAQTLWHFASFLCAQH